MKTALTLAGMLALGLAGASPAAAGDLGEFAWNPRLNDHLSPYDGRPLGPPVSAFGPVYDDGDPRSSQVPRYDYYNGRLIVTGPQGTFYAPGDAYGVHRPAARTRRPVHRHR